VKKPKATASAVIELDALDAEAVRKVLRLAKREWSAKNLMGEPVAPVKAQYAQGALRILDPRRTYG
jgi:hypothetical protein